MLQGEICKLLYTFYILFEFCQNTRLTIVKLKCFFLLN